MKPEENDDDFFDSDDELMELVGDMLSEGDEEESEEKKTIAKSKKEREKDLGSEEGPGEKKETSSQVQNADGKSADNDFEFDIEGLDLMDDEEKVQKTEKIKAAPESEASPVEKPSIIAAPEEKEIPVFDEEEVVALIKTIPRVGEVLARRIVAGHIDSYEKAGTIQIEEIISTVDLGPVTAGKIVEKLYERYTEVPGTESEEEVVADKGSGEELGQPEVDEERKATEEIIDDSGKKEEKAESDSKIIDKESEESPEADKAAQEGDGKEGKAEEGKDEKEKGAFSKFIGKFKTIFSSKEKKKGDDLENKELGEESEESTDERPEKPEDETDRVIQELENESEPEKPLDKDAQIDLYVEMLSIDRKVADSLYNIGYKKVADLKEAIPEDLVFVEGINPTLARAICDKLK